MSVQSLQDIIGPIMIGPSSSHTAGALRISYMARKLCSSKPKTVDFILYGSFAHTYEGHGTDKALCAGILGMDADDMRIRDSLEIAQEEQVEITFVPRPKAEFDHPNTVDILIAEENGNTLTIRGESIGGGSAVITRINDIDVYITGEHTSIVIKQQDEKGVLAHIATCISVFGINIATTRVYRERRGKTAYTIIETDEQIPSELKRAIEDFEAIKLVKVIPADAVSQKPDVDADEALDFTSGEQLLEYCKQNRCSIAQAFQERERAFHSEEETDAYVASVLEVMRESATVPLKNAQPSMGGLIGGEAQKLNRLYKMKEGVCCSQLSLATTYAMAVLETNASMGRIVAAPTAGSSGVIPAVLLTLQKEYDLSDEVLKDALITAAAIGYLIARNATVSGAEGGCQAEIGSAAAMAAAAAVEMVAIGSPQIALDAASNALSNMMGLVCDPIGGLVEVPCQKRNASGATTALVSAQIALSGVENLVNFDQTVEAMYKVGRALPFELRETALGGIAATPAACQWCAGK